MKLKIEFHNSKGRSLGFIEIQPKDWSEATRMAYRALVEKLRAVLAGAPTRATISHGERTYSISAATVAREVFRG